MHVLAAGSVSAYVVESQLGGDGVVELLQLHQPAGSLGVRVAPERLLTLLLLGLALYQRGAGGVQGPAGRSLLLEEGRGPEGEY